MPRLLRKARKRLPRPIQWQIGDVARALRAELKAEQPDLAHLERLADHVDELAVKHLEQGFGSELWEYAEIVIVALLIALFLRANLFEPFKIPSGSMIPTLRVGDHIFVAKFIYGIRVPWSNEPIMAWRKPGRGEVIVFVNPSPGPDEGIDFIKRVVAVPGDQVRLENNLVYINGEIHGDTRIVARAVPCQLAPGEKCDWTPLIDEDEGRGFVGRRASEVRVTGECLCDYVLEQSNGYTWLTQHVSPNVECVCNEPARDGLRRPTQHRLQNTADWPDPSTRWRRLLAGWGWDGKGHERRRAMAEGQWAMTVPDHHVFVMGDNRDNSEDGRFWGLVPYANIRGKALFIWWAGDDVWGRIFRRVH